jgi:hypothetical protein
MVRVADESIDDQPYRRLASAIDARDGVEPRAREERRYLAQDDGRDLHDVPGEDRHERDPQAAPHVFERCRLGHDDDDARGQRGDEQCTLQSAWLMETFHK